RVGEPVDDGVTNEVVDLALVLGEVGAGHDLADRGRPVIGDVYTQVRGVAQVVLGRAGVDRVTVPADLIAVARHLSILSRDQGPCDQRPGPESWSCGHDTTRLFSSSSYM